MSHLLAEVVRWPLDARAEDPQRYFFHVSETSAIASGESAYVIGRKGTGKTALAEYLLSTRDYNVFAAKLSFRNVAFEGLYAHPDALFTPPSQFISLWKYIIYVQVAILCRDNEALPHEFRNLLRQVFSDDPMEQLATRVARWTSGKAGLEAWAMKVSGELGRTLVANDTPLGRRVEALEMLLRQNLNGATYIIVFDELDEDFRQASNPRYIPLITSLFKAVADVRHQLSGSRVWPVVFLRDDIHQYVEDPEATKWDDATVTLDWNSETLKSLLGFRISRALDQNSTPAAFHKAWSYLVKDNFITLPGKKSRRKHSFEYILDLSLNRPRDFVKFLKLAAETALQAGRTQLTSIDFNGARSTFCNYMRRDLGGEIAGSFSHFKGVMEVLKDIGGTPFTFAEFDVVLKQHTARGVLPSLDTEDVLTHLFAFSAIGIQPQGGHVIYRFREPDARFATTSALLVHPAIAASLRLRRR